METIIEEYLKFIQIEKGLSENTIGAYRRDLKKYQLYMQEQKIAHIDFIDRQTIQECLGSLIDQGASKNPLQDLFQQYVVFINLLYAKNIFAKRSYRFN